VSVPRAHLMYLSRQQQRLWWVNRTFLRCIDLTPAHFVFLLHHIATLWCETLLNPPFHIAQVSIPHRLRVFKHLALQPTRFITVPLLWRGSSFSPTVNLPVCWSALLLDIITGALTLLLDGRVERCSRVPAFLLGWSRPWWCFQPSLFTARSHQFYLLYK